MKKQKHFDLILSNPPYNDCLDLKILNFIFEYTDKIIFIHPSTFLLDKKNLKSIFNTIKKYPYLENVNLFWGNNIFDIALFTPLCISVWNTKKEDSNVNVFDNAFLKEKYVVNNINNISIHGDFFILENNFLNKIYDVIKENGSLLSHKYDDKTNIKNIVKFAVIRGNVPIKVNKNISLNKDFFSLVSLDYKRHLILSNKDLSKYKKNQFLCFNFETKEEQLNFINYCKTKFVRFCLSLLKTNGNLNRGETKLIPWMDFTQEWNDAKLCKEFNISKELWEYIDNFIPNYYDDYKSGF